MKTLLALINNLTILLVLFCLSCDAYSDRQIALNASVTQGQLNFNLVSLASEPIKISRDFTHYQNMYLVVLLEKNYGQVISPNNIFGGDPAVGTYSLRNKESVEEKIDLIALYPELATSCGNALVFWSTDLHFYTGSNSKSERLSGSLRVNLPLKKP